MNQINFCILVCFTAHIRPGRRNYDKTENTTERLLLARRTSIVKEMGLEDHLGELRTRVIRIGIILVVSFFICFGFGQEIADFLLSPLRQALSEIYGKSDDIKMLSVLDGALSKFQIALWAGVILSSPVWFHQIWLFIRPALYPKELKVVRPFLFVGFLLFALGVCFGYFLVFPYGFVALMSMGPEGVGDMIDMRSHLLLSVKALVFLGFMFQIPNIMLILGLIEIITVKKLNEWRRYVYVVFAFLAAFFTPPDLFTMGALWVPLVILFELGTIGVWLFAAPYVKRKKQL